MFDFNLVFGCLAGVINIGTISIHCTPSAPSDGICAISSFMFSIVMCAFMVVGSYPHGADSVPPAYIMFYICVSINVVANIISVILVVMADPKYRNTVSVVCAILSTFAACSTVIAYMLI